VLDKKTYWTGDFYLLSRAREPDSLIYDDLVLYQRIDSLKIYMNAVTRGYPMLFDHNRLKMPGWLAYTVFYSGPLDDIVKSRHNYLLLSLEVENPQPPFESELICEISRGGEVIYWSARAFHEFTLSDWGRYRIHLAVKLADLGFNYEDEEIRIYLSNLDEAYYYLNYFKMETLGGNPGLYSLFQKIPE
jgi:hypothetical protein